MPLITAYDIFNKAYANVGGTARTVRGPSMTTPGGKLGIVGVSTIGGERVFGLKFYSARNPEWINRMFFAKVDPHAVWFDELEPAFGDTEFFWEKECKDIVSRASETSSGQMF